MRFIKQVVIEHFQSHERTVLDLSPGLNVIVGPSDQGKSAIIRALRWVLYNEPRGTDFIQAGANFARVTLFMDDGVVVRRERSLSGRNRYYLQEPGKEEKVFEGFGWEVPPEIAAATGAARLFWDEGRGIELNVSRQLEGPFLLMENGAVKARAVGMLGGVHILDAAQEDVQSDLRRRLQEEKKGKQELLALEEELKRFENLPLLEERLLALEALRAEIERLGAVYGELTRLAEEIAACRREMAAQEKLLRLLAPLSRAEALFAELESLAEELAFLKELEGEIAAGKKGVAKAEEIISQTLGLEEAARLVASLESLRQELWQLAEVAQELRSCRAALLEAEKLLAKTASCPQLAEELEILQELSQELKELSRLAGEWQELKKSYEAAEKAAAAYGQEFEAKKKLYEEALRAAGRCPVCLQEITPAALQRVLEEYV